MLVLGALHIFDDVGCKFHLCDVENHCSSKLIINYYEKQL